MDPVTALGTVITVINTLAGLEPEMVKAWGNLKTFGTALFEEFTGQPISDADRVALETQLDDLHAQLQVPLPPAQPGDPDYVDPNAPPATPPAAT